MSLSMRSVQSLEAVGERRRMYQRVHARTCVGCGCGGGLRDEPARRPKPERRVRTTVSVFCQCPALICMPEA